MSPEELDAVRHAAYAAVPLADEPQSQATLPAPGPDALLRQVEATTRERCAQVLSVTNADLLLMAGEMDADTLLTVQAVLKGMQYLIRNPR